jgi:hypothetical protein
MRLHCVDELNLQVLIRRLSGRCQLAAHDVHTSRNLPPRHSNLPGVPSSPNARDPRSLLPPPSWNPQLTGMGHCRDLPPQSSRCVQHTTLGERLDGLFQSEESRRGPSAA